MNGMTSRMAGLSELLRTMAPELHDGVYVFATLPAAADLRPLEPLATFREAEGTTVIVRADTARHMKIPVVFRAAWITLGVHSDLQAVGLTAAIATALAERGISCNVVAAAFHDHLFVSLERAKEALACLKRLQQLAIEGGSS
jgi:uncharacterized protein